MIFIAQVLGYNPLEAELFEATSERLENVLKSLHLESKDLLLKPALVYLD